MAEKQIVQQPLPSPCPECGAIRVAAEGISSVRVHKPGSAFLPGLTNADTEFWALVCPNCGYTSWYAKEPSKLEG